MTDGTDATEGDRDRVDGPGRDDVWDLIPAYALGAVDDLERRAVERLVSADPEAQRALDEYREVVAAFVVDTPLPDAARASVLAEVATASQAGGARYRSGHPARRRWVAVAVAAAAVVVIAVPTTVAVRATQERERLQAQADTVAAMLADPSAAILRGPVAGGGEATVLASGDDMLFRASDLPGAGDGKDYQLWVVGEDGGVVSAGVLTDRSGAVTALVQDEPGVGMAVTIEPDGGSDQPTSDPIVVLRA